MIIFPAVDIKDGRCVRLYQGRFDTAEQVFDSPLASALRFREEGATHLHLVDLDGSLEKKPVNGQIICRIKKETGMFCEVGGGIRTMRDIEAYVSAGIDRVILGTAALQDSGFVKQALARYPENVSVGIDAKDGYVCANGWLEESRADFVSFAKKMEQLGVRHIVYTDIATDGTLRGPNFGHLAMLQKAVGMEITASGGIRDAAHIEKLKNMGLYGAICGKSLYSGSLKLSEII